MELESVGLTEGQTQVLAENMKPKLIGLLLLAVVVLAAGGCSFYRENGRVTVLRGYLGGEKTGLFENEEAARILERLSVSLQPDRAFLL